MSVSSELSTSTANSANICCSHPAPTTVNWTLYPCFLMID
jgi:hypothetical protein